MPRPEKVQAVADIKERIEGANAVFLAEYAGLSVKEQQELRRSLRAGGAEFKVVKMTLTRRAAEELDLASLDELLVGPTGLAFADGDPVTAAKALDDFAKAHEVFAIKGGLLGRDFLAPEKVRELAKIEPREVLLAKLAGAFQAPLANLAGLLAALPRGFATAMSQLIEQRAEEGGDGDAEPAAPADEAAEASADSDESAAGEEATPEAAAEEGEGSEPATDEPDDTPEGDAAPSASAASDEAAPADDGSAEDESAPVEHAKDEARTEDPNDEPAATAEEEETNGEDEH